MALWPSLFRGFGWARAGTSIMDPPAILQRSPVEFDRRRKVLLRLVTLGGGNRLAAHAPELFDASNAPEGTSAQGANRLSGDGHNYRIRVHLWKVPQSDPGAPFQLQRKLKFMDRAVRRHFLRSRDRTVDDQFRQALAATLPDVIGTTRIMEVDRVTE